MVVKKKDVLQMRQFVTNMIENNSKYTILSSEKQHIIFMDQEDKTYCTLLHANTHLETKKKIKNHIEGLHSENIITHHVFYKDYNNFFIKAKTHHPFEKGGHKYETLKKYSLEETQRMIKLRDNEENAIFRKTVISNRQVPNIYFQLLTYYQAKTERLEESLKTFNLEPVIFNYTHLKEEEIFPGFKEQKISIENRIVEELYSGNESVNIYLLEGRKKGIMIPINNQH